ncbi:hypothetical protein GGD63_000728 [Bradyrhizobium sp. cir1]|uniref:hypothetical protein n=1 Tax=Bradyrhizobium sp. cir1 TaxID=1445730 RepID=UPI001606ED80|nr:hypothetical protein [Bradyrhizobium sp. cir1]MBB4367959.1 hypothetical protein [Bradyrhizobium sp. cir1]
MTAAPDEPKIRAPDELTLEDMDVVTGGVFAELRDALSKAIENVHRAPPATPLPGGPVPVPYPNTAVTSDKA